MNAKSKLLTVSLILAVTPQLQAVENIFIPQAAAWHEDGHWSLGHYPFATEDVRIPAGKTVYITNNTNMQTLALAKSVIVESGAGIDAENSYRLRLHDNSTVNGTLCIYDGAALEISGNITISGTGAFEPESLAAPHLGIVRGLTSNDTLTLASGFTFRGAAEIQITLINNGSIIASDFGTTTFGTIKLTVNPKSGGGTWETESSTGKFEVAVPVTVNNEFRITQAGKLVITDNTTFNGSGTIKLNDATALIESNPTDKTLTIASGLTVRGFGEIKANLVNNGQVSANGGTLKLTTGSKSGTGVWQTETIGAVFDVGVPITLGGEFRITGGGILRLTNNATFSGAGTILMTGISSVIETSMGKTLTVGSGLTVKGLGQITANLINNGRVVASDGMLELLSGAKAGSGVWAAETEFGVLKIGTAVTGDGDWELINNAGAKILVESSCPCLKGDVTIWKGTLDADNNFITEGNLNLKSIYALVEVNGGKTVLFGEPLPGSCGMTE